MSKAAATFRESLDEQHAELRFADGKGADTALANLSITMSNAALVYARLSQWNLAVSWAEEGLLVQQSVLGDDHHKSFARGLIFDLLRRLRDGENESSNYGFNYKDTVKELNDVVTMGNDSDFRSLGVLMHGFTAQQCVVHAMRSIYWDQALHERSAPINILSIQDDYDKKEIGSEIFLKMICDQAATHLKRKNFNETIQLFLGSLHILREKHGDSHHMVGRVFHKIGIVHIQAEEYESALFAFQEAVNVQVALLGSDHPDITAFLEKVGLTQLSLGEIDRSIDTFFQILHIRRKHFGYDDPKAARILNVIGCMHFELGGRIAALKAFEEAIEILQNNSANKPRDEAVSSGTQALILSNIGFLHAKQEEILKASSLI